MTPEAFDRDFREQRRAQALREHPDRIAGRQPNAHLRAETGDLRPGLALDAGCGHGSTSEILAYPATGGASNGPIKAVNLLIEKPRRIGHASRNLDNHRLRLSLICGLRWNTPSGRNRPRPAHPDAHLKPR